MINTNELVCQSSECPNCFGHPAMLSVNFAERMVNIAGLEFGDTVVCMGDTGSAIEAAIVKNGSRALCSSAADKGNKWNASRLVGSTRSDAVLWAADLSRQNAMTESLSAIRKHLRRGGRLVMWAPPDGCREAQACAEHIQRILAAAGFTSVIVGQTPSDVGDLTVATGILGTNARQQSERKATRGHFSR